MSQRRHRGRLCARATSAFDRSVAVDDDGRVGHGGPRSGAATIVRVVTKTRPADGRQFERTDISGVSVLQRVEPAALSDQRFVIALNNM
jgi:hypothetical protein